MPEGLASSIREHLDLADLARALVKSRMEK
jgi:hypothetical protein